MKVLTTKFLWLLLGSCVVVMVILLCLDLKNTQKKPHTDMLKLELKKEPPIIDNAVHVCASVDSNDLLGLVAMVNSVLKNTKSRVNFHFLCTEQIKQHLIDWLGGKSFSGIVWEVKVFNGDHIQPLLEIQDKKRQIKYNIMNIARIYYAEYFPDLHGNIIHLDADVIVQGDISELANVQLYPGHVIAVSEDCHSPSKRFTSFPPFYNSFINLQNDDIKSLGLDPHTCSFNTGVYVADLDAWRRQNITQQMEKWLKLNSQSDVFGSERGAGSTGPIMMIVFYKNYSPIKDPMWNLRYLGLGSARHLSTTFVSHGKLLHWSGPLKPWMAMAQYANIWDRYYVKDPQKKYKPSRRVTVLGNKVN